MVLVHILTKMNVDFSIAHMNYGLRGEESNQDEKFVVDYAKKVGVECFVAQANMDELNRQSIQMVARTKRYDWFQELMDTYEFEYILTAHHLNDSIETTLLNFVKGTGINGLVGIAPKKDKILRPLLTFSKEELRSFAIEQGLQWREDASNSESKYMRNKIRNEVIPELTKINPSLLETFRTTNERLVGVAQLLKMEVQRIVDEYQTEANDRVVLDMSWYRFNEMNNVLLSEVLRPFGVDFLMTKEIGGTSTTGAVFQTKSNTLSYDRGKLWIAKRDDEAALEALTIHEEGDYKWGNWKMSVRSSPGVSYSTKDSSSAYLDGAHINFPIVVRSWAEGDEFVPLGMSGKKKISDFMIDNKIPLTLKKHIPLFAIGDEIFWIGGYRIADRFKITDQTKEVLSIKITRRD